MQGRWRNIDSVTVRLACAGVLGAAMALGCGAALACTTGSPIVTPSPVQAAAAADLVAIVRIDEQIPLSSEEQAEFDRLWHAPPADTLIVYPAPKLRFGTVRVLKGQMPEGVLIQNGATTCEVVLQAGAQYVLFAKLPSLDGVRLWPLDGTFPLGPSEYDQAKLADVERYLSSSLPSKP